MENMEVKNIKHRGLYIFLSLLVIAMFVACTNSDNSNTGSTPDSMEPQTTLALNPSEDNPRNSEGDFVKLKDGRILFIYSRYVGDSSSDHAPASLAARYSTDGGETWTSEDEIVVPNEGGMNVMSVSLLRLQNGEIALFYARKNSITDCIPMMRISKDEAETWSDPIPCITDRKGYFVLNNDRVIQLADGRLMVPVSLHNTPDGVWHNKGNLYNYYLDDNGLTWTLLLSEFLPPVTG